MACLGFRRHLDKGVLEFRGFFFCNSSANHPPSPYTVMFKGVYFDPVGAKDSRRPSCHANRRAMGYTFS